jgi:transposase
VARRINNLGVIETMADMMLDSSPNAIAGRLHELDQPLDRVGLEAGPLSQWIYAGLVEKDIAAICVETRHMQAALSAWINKTARNDARGIAQMMRVGLFKAVHVKTPASQHRRLLLTSRKLLQRKIYDIENDLSGSLRLRLASSAQSSSRIAFMSS